MTHTAGPAGTMSTGVYAGVLLITALHAFDELVLIIALPTIAPQLDADLYYGLIIASYKLASIVGMSWAGENLDRYGPRRILWIAAGCFIAGLLVAASAWDGISFVVGRILQGLGGGMGWTLTFGLISLLCTAEQQPRALAGMDVAWVLPSLLAPLLGGVLVDVLNWRWVFLLQLPLSLLTLVLILPRIVGLDGQGARPSRRLILDSVQIAVATGLLLFALSRTPGAWWLLLPVAVLLMRTPMKRFLPPGWWRIDRPLGLALVMIFVAFSMFYLAESYQPLYLVKVRGLSSVEAGLVLSCASIAWMAGSQAAARGWLARDHHFRLLWGFVLMAAGLGSLGLVLFLDATILWCYPAWLITGLGMGINFNTCRVIAMQDTVAGQEGSIGSAVNLVISLGLSMATGVGGALLNQAERGGQGLVTGIEWIWWLSVALAAGAVVLLMARVSRLRGQAGTWPSGGS